jgi:predicted transcriptional regulator
MNGEPMKKNPVTFRLATGETTMANGDVLTETDFEQMADEAETTEIDVERLLDRQRRGVGRPALGNGTSPVLQVRLDEQTRQQLTERAEREHTTPSRIARDAIQAFLLTSYRELPENVDDTTADQTPGSDVEGSNNRKPFNWERHADGERLTIVPIEPVGFKRRLHPHPEVV